MLSSWTRTNESHSCSKRMFVVIAVVENCGTAAFTNDIYLSGRIHSFTVSARQIHYYMIEQHLSILHACALDTVYYNHTTPITITQHTFGIHFRKQGTHWMIAHVMCNLFLLLLRSSFLTCPISHLWVTTFCQNQDPLLVFMSIMGIFALFILYFTGNWNLCARCP
jgi:hypothetical protein